MSIRKRQVKHLGCWCVGPTITLKKIKQLKKGLEKNQELERAKKYFGILAGKTRLDILYLLRREKELCVCDLANILETTVSAVSHQLKILRQREFVKTRRDAQTIFYSLTSEGEKEVKNHF